VVTWFGELKPLVWFQLVKIEPKPSLIFGIIIKIYIFEKLDLNSICMKPVPKLRSRFFSKRFDLRANQRLIKNQSLITI